MTLADTTSKPPSRPRRAIWIWLAVYLVFVVAVVAIMLQIRRATLSGLDTPAARAEWEAWRDSPPNTRDDLPVRRRRPFSEEPPALVLMRDHFPVMMAAAVFFGSLLFAAIGLGARGALAREGPVSSSDGKTRRRQ